MPNDQLSHDVSKTCKHCNKTFTMKASAFANHSRWCDKNPNAKFGGYTSLNTKLKASSAKKSAVEYTLSCKKCSAKFKVKCTPAAFKLGNHKIFCSRRCANSHLVSDETKLKISKNMVKLINDGNPVLFGKNLDKSIAATSEQFNDICKNCNNQFINWLRLGKAKLKSCSKKCSMILNRSTRNIEYRKTADARKLYRSDASFKFSLNDFPNEFDFSLIEQYGWYKAKNRGNNLNGISRDHMVSVMYGFRNNIDPKIISHPANCQLVRHNDNIAKLDKCSITIEELLERIKIWDAKYPTL